MLLWAALIALADAPMTLRTSVFVLALSNASLCSSIVESVPSICCSCFSNLFFLFNARSAAEISNKYTNYKRGQTNGRLTGGVHGGVKHYKDTFLRKIFTTRN